jgi:hypothetical protein
LRLILWIGLALLLSSPGHAEDQNSATFWQPKCKSLLLPKSGDVVSGACMGMMLVLKSTGHLLHGEARVCVPLDTTIEQMLRVITNFIDAQPELAHLPFVDLSIYAMRAAWPCKS